MQRKIHTISSGRFAARLFSCQRNKLEIVRQAAQQNAALAKDPEDTEYACECMSSYRISLLFIFIVLTAFPSRSNEPVTVGLQGCVSYEPAKVALKGTISRRTFMNASDEKEVVWILRLVKPVCVIADDGSDFNVERSRVTDVQLVLDAAMYAKYRRLLGKKVKAAGTLFGEHTAHHFTPVLLDVTAVDLLP